MKLQPSTLFLIIVFLFSLIFKPDKDLDLFRYYQGVHLWDNLDYYQVMLLNIEDHGDFLYFVMLKIFVDWGLPVQLVTAIFATLYYKGALLILEDNFKKGVFSVKGKMLAESALFFTIPIHLILSIARMTCSFSFAFLAIHMYNNKKYFWALFLITLSLCSHTGTVIFLGVFLTVKICLYLVGRISHLSSKKVAAYMIFGGVLIIYLFSFLEDLLVKIPFFETHSYYLKYVENIRSASYMENGFITFFAMMLYIVLNAFYAFKSNLNEKSLYCTCICCTVPVFYFLGNLFSMRSCMFSIPFFVVCLMGAYSSSRNKAVYKVITVFTTLVFVLVLVAFNRLYI